MIPFLAISFSTPALNRLARYLIPYKRTLLLAIVFMLLAAGASSLIALLLGKLTDSGFYETDPGMVLAAPVGLIVIAGINGLSMLMSNYCLGMVSQSVMMTLRRELFSRILRWSVITCQNNPTGLIASKFINEANFALSSAAKSAIILVRDSVQTVALCVVLVWHNWLLAIVSLCLAPVVIKLLRWISQKIKSVMYSSQQNVATLIMRVKETYEAERLIKISGTYDREKQRFREVNNQIADLAIRINKISSIGTPATQLIGMTGVAIVLGIALWQTQQGMITLGEFVTFLTAMLLVLQPLKRLAGVNAAIVGMSVAAESIFQTLDEPLEKDEGTVELQHVQGSVSFEHVSLRYPDAERDAVNDFNLDVKSGESIALVGFSGSGKTSVVNMIPRFWNPTAGRILIDGMDTKDVTLSSLRSQIAIVSQDVVLFDGTIRENIAYAMPEVTEEALTQAVEAAALKEFIASLPLGLDTPVGEAGSRLSGGQKQRISIARAILRNTPILILDEATSALDSESEAAIKTALDRLMAGRTTFIVAHRLSTIRNASRIVVMSDGVIQEIGTHEALLEKGGAYANLSKLQSL